jgi:hypothetical protein
LHIGMMDQVQGPRRFSSNDENEVLDTDGEWAGCTKRFLKPLRISTRGPGTNDCEKEAIEYGYRVLLFCRDCRSPCTINEDFYIDKCFLSFFSFLS